MAKTNDNHYSLMKQAMKAPYLEREHEHDLAVLWKENQDQEALNILTQSHMRLVISMAAKFKNYGLPMPDLIQEGHVGLLEAAARFDPDREVRFSTYATWWIRASIQDYILRNWSIVRGGTSSAQKSLFFNLRRLRAQLSKGDTKPDTAKLHKDIAEAIGVSEKDVATMDSRLSGYDYSLNAPLKEGDGEEQSQRMDFLVDDEPIPEVKVMENLDGEKRQEWLYKAMETLNERELKIINLRQLADQGMTLEALGKDLGISKERVRQIESKAFEKLKTALCQSEHQVESFI